MRRIPFIPLDLRSDVVALPSPEMWEAMRRWEFHGSLKGDDDTIGSLEAEVANILGKEAAMFVPTCTVANLLALMTLGRPGASVWLGETSHIATSEDNGFATVAGLTPRFLDDRYGVLNGENVEFAMANFCGLEHDGSGLLCIENSHTHSGGAVTTHEQTRAIAALAERRGVAIHLDGARLFNASAALGISPRWLAEPAVTVAVSLNKGLGAPYGALLSGSNATIQSARVVARRIGLASIHKAGMFAAAAIVALRDLDRLAEQNRRAEQLAHRLADLRPLRVDLNAVQTNIVTVEIDGRELSAAQFVAKLASHGIMALQRGPGKVRFVIHRAIGDAEIDRVVQGVEAVLAPNVLVLNGVA